MFIDPFNSAPDPTDEGNIINLRSRARRFEPNRFADMVKLPGAPAPKASQQNIMVAAGERLSRHIHMSAPQPVRKLPHIPLSGAAARQISQKIIQAIREKITEQILLLLLPQPKSFAPALTQIPTAPLTKISLPEPKYIAPKKTFPEKKKSKLNLNLKETAKFVLTSAAVFLVTLIGINFSAYYQMVEAFIRPERIAAIARDLGDLSDPQSKVAHTPLLPIAGVERKDLAKIPDFLNVMPPDNRLIIPKLGKNIPIIDHVGMNALLAENWKELEASIQGGLHDGVVHYPGTGDPGEPGNVFITGHSSYYPWDDGKYKNVFALLGNLEVGDSYSVIWQGNEYRYKIIERKIVKPEDTSVLNQPPDKEIATLMTCWPVGTTASRLIYIAEREK